MSAALIGARGRARVAYRRVVIRVPASCGNLGPGYDSLGLALGLYDELEVVAGYDAAGGDSASGNPALSVEVSGENTGPVPLDANNLVARTVLSTLRRMGVAAPGLRLRCRNRIPHGRGLGSSSAAIVAGLVAARALVEDDEGPAGTVPAEPLRAETLRVAAELEGHPDNVAPALLGGLTVAWTEAGQARAVRLEPGELEVVAFVPEEAVSTASARAVLPDRVPHRDATANVSRAALLVAALAGTTTPATPATIDRELLLTATQDLLHQPYRAPLMPRSAELLEGLRADGVPAVISGAGPTVLACTDADGARELAGRTVQGFEVRRLAVDRQGARVLERTPM